MEVEMVDCPATVLPEHTAGVGVIDHHDRADLFRHGHQVRQWGNVPVHAEVPTASFAAGRPNRMIPGMPIAAISFASLASSSTERWKQPGIEEISWRTLCPWTTKSG